MKNKTFKIYHYCKSGNNQLKKMLFIYNSLESGWSVKKENNEYVFFKENVKNHTEIELENFLLTNMYKS